MARQRHPFDLWAYVIMPEHMHLLVRPDAAISVSDILSAVKQSAAKRVRLWAPEARPQLYEQMADVRPNGRVIRRFWLRGRGYDRNLWSTAEIHEKIRYIHANPVRRGLVGRPQDWPWSSWRAWYGIGGAPMSVDRDSLPPLVR